MHQTHAVRRACYHRLVLADNGPAAFGGKQNRRNARYLGRMQPQTGSRIVYERAGFIRPTADALVDQLRDDLAESFPKSLTNYDVSADGDLVSFIIGPELSAAEVMTPERLLAVLSFADADVADVGLIVFDECQLLSPTGDGARSVDAMLCLIHALRRAPQADYLPLSAMLPEEAADAFRARITTDLPAPTAKSSSTVLFFRRL
jgi:hypothetical protein